MAEDSPNRDIDKALKELMKRISTEPTDVAVKVINSAVAWEKVKHRILDSDDGFDPDNL